MAIEPHILVTQYRQRAGNVLIFYEGHFLLLPSDAFEVCEGGLLVSKASLAEALDLTPNLPERILASAWRHRMVFANEVKADWALSVARNVEKLSGHDVIQAFYEKARLNGAWRFK